MSPIPFGILGTGSAVPEGVITNADLSELVDTSDEWITQRTGIKERHQVGEDQATTDLCVQAAKAAIADAGIEAEDIDLLVLATVTPDQHVPASSCKIAAELGMTKTPAFDIAAGCTGFVYATNVAAQFIWSGTYKKVLVIGAECLTRITDYTDRSSCILFGDAAGAVIYGTDHQYGELATCSIEADGNGYDVMHQRAGGSKLPLTEELLHEHKDKLVVHGKQVYQFAVRKMVELVQLEQERNPGLELAGVIPHQMNLRIIEAARERLELPDDRIFVNIQKYGNTSAASIPLAIDEARREGWFDDASGKLIVLCAFGAGLTWGSVGIRW